MEPKEQSWLHIFRTSLFVPQSSIESLRPVLKQIDCLLWIKAINMSAIRLFDKSLITSQSLTIDRWDQRHKRCPRERRAWIDVWVGAEFTQGLKRLIYVHTKPLVARSPTFEHRRDRTRDTEAKTVNAAFYGSSVAMFKTLYVKLHTCFPAGVVIIDWPANSTVHLPHMLPVFNMMEVRNIDYNISNQWSTITVVIKYRWKSTVIGWWWWS